MASLGRRIIPPRPRATPGLSRGAPSAVYSSASCADASLASSSRSRRRLRGEATARRRPSSRCRRPGRPSSASSWRRRSRPTAARVFVATRDGVVRALDPRHGRGRLEGRGASRAAERRRGSPPRARRGRHPHEPPPANRAPCAGPSRRASPGEMPAVVDGDRALVAGRAWPPSSSPSGRALWADLTGAATTAPPVVGRLAGPRRRGRRHAALPRPRHRPAALGARTARRPVAPPLVDESRRRLYLGTTDKRILEVHLDDGARAGPGGSGPTSPTRGSSARARCSSPPTTPCSTPCARAATWTGARRCPRARCPLRSCRRLPPRGLPRERDRGLHPGTGKPAGRLQTPAEIRAAPLVAGSLLVLGLRDRSVVAYALPGAALPR